MIIKLANEDIDLLTLLLTKIHLYTRNWLRYLLVSISVSISNSRHIYTLIANELIHIEGFTTAILEGGNNETVLHENRSYFPEERKCIVFALQHGSTMMSHENALFWTATKLFMIFVICRHICELLRLLNLLLHENTCLSSPGLCCIKAQKALHAVYSAGGPNLQVAGWKLKIEKKERKKEKEKITNKHIL